MTEQTQVAKARRLRSPAYPGVNLEIAIERAKTLYEKERGNHFVPITAVVEHWGYSPKSSPGLVTLAALKKFGLLEDRGSGEDREVMLTDLAMAILVPQSEQERITAIKEAALKPDIHVELWEQYKGQLPSDATLRAHLIRQRDFNQSAVEDFIAEFRHTIEFANLATSGNISTRETDKTEDDQRATDLVTRLPNPFTEPRKSMEPSTKLKEPPKKREQRIVQIPLLDNEWVALQLPVPMSREDWEQFIAVLNAMKPGLLNKSEKSQTDVAAPSAAIQSSKLTKEAQDLLDQVESGGVPMYVTDNLRRIASQNGIEITDRDTPNDVIKALRAIDE